MSEIMRFGKGVRSVTILSRDATGQVSPTTVYERSTKKKKGSRMLKPVESFVRRATDSAATGAERYIVRHKKSSAKRKDGWLREMPANLIKAFSKGSRRMKMNRWMMM